jgi:putative hydrolase of the HAD superfamily
MRRGVILWDFDGTLARRSGLWSGCLLEVLDEHEPAHGLTREGIRAQMRGRYPWNAPEQAHQHLCEAGAWWAEMERRMAEALFAAGVEQDRTAVLARAAHERFLDASIGWELYADALPALTVARAAGWRAAILSNHVPELARLADELGLAGRFESVFTSAEVGYEKPRPELFRHALAELGEPERVWMVGDNPCADVAGAEAVGIPAVLVRGVRGASRTAPALLEALAIIEREGAATRRASVAPR